MYFGWQYVLFNQKSNIIEYYTEQITVRDIRVTIVLTNIL